MSNFFQLLRINNWIKNLLVLAPLIFSLNIFHITKVIQSLEAFAAFCLISSAIYIFNDILDIEKDKIHPRKKYRPLASGKISILRAFIIALVLTALSLSVSWFLSFNFTLVIFSYLVLNSLYNIKLKTVPLIEAFIIAINFLIRIIAGSVAISVIPTEWIVFVTFFLATMLTFIKRKSEIKVLESKSGEHRSVLKHYNLQTINQLIFISATLTLAGYVLYTINHPLFQNETINWLFYSFIFVAFGLFRFILISDSEQLEKEGDPTILILKDRYLQLTILLWILYVIWAIYFKK